MFPQKVGIEYLIAIYYIETLGVTVAIIRSNERLCINASKNLQEMKGTVCACTCCKTTLICRFVSESQACINWLEGGGKWLVGGKLSPPPPPPSLFQEVLIRRETCCASRQYSQYMRRHGRKYENSAFRDRKINIFLGCMFADLPTSTLLRCAETLSENIVSRASIEH